MNINFKNRNFILIGLIALLWLVVEKLLASSNLSILKTGYLNEESILIFNFFLLLFFLYRMIGETLGGFLHARYLAVRDEAQRALLVYRDSALKLRTSYTIRRDLEELLTIAFVSVYKPYAEFRKRREPYLLKAVVNQRTAFVLSTLYREETYALGSNYLRRFEMLKSALTQEVETSISFLGGSSVTLSDEESEGIINTI